MTIEDFIQLAITEDIGNGDITSLSCVPAQATSSARLLVKAPGILAGVEVALKVWSVLDPDLNVEVYLHDGAEVNSGDVAFLVSGSARSILKGERLVLNLMQRMSGIATYTHRLVQHLHGTKAILLDTRKTTPGFRQFEKWAVRIGGGQNHRNGLYDMVMIKDNHVDFAGGIEQAITACRHYLSHTSLNVKVEVECRNMEEVQEVLKTGGVDRIMLDNFSPEQLRQALENIKGRFETEASGGITETNLRSYAETGVDYISIGALTHSYRSLDLSLKAVS
jgi:nicotinate-nucleotide pyrophosphorylase (carboxylating)